MYKDKVFHELDVLSCDMNALCNDILSIEERISSLDFLDSDVKSLLNSKIDDSFEGMFDAFTKIRHIRVFLNR